MGDVAPPAARSPAGSLVKDSTGTHLGWGRRGCPVPAWRRRGSGV